MAIRAIILICLLPVVSHAQGIQSPAKSIGTGLLVSGQGHILTSWHMGASCDHYHVQMQQNTYLAEKIGEDPLQDISLLKLPVTVPRYFSISVKASEDGQLAMAGFRRESRHEEPTLSDISVIPNIVSPHASIMFNGKVQPGNSGAPLLDKRGKVMGMVVRKATVKKVITDSQEILHQQEVGIAVPALSLNNILQKYQVDAGKSPPQLPMTQSQLKTFAADRLVRIVCEVSQKN